MYILADNFAGNIIKSETLYMKNRTLYYTNDREHWRYVQIAKEDLHEGYITDIYTYIPIYENVDLNMFSDSVKKIFSSKEVDGRCIKVLFLKLTIDKENEIKEIFPIEDYKVKEPSIRLNEYLLPSGLENAKLIHDFQLGVKIVTSEDSIDDKLKNAPDMYRYVLCMPKMIYSEAIKMYSFDNQLVFHTLIK